MKLTAVYEPTKDGSYTCFLEEIPVAISQGETIEKAKANLADALKLVLQCQHGCALYREGAAHSIWLNPKLHKISSVPRHREIKEGTARAICKQLVIPRP